MGSGDTFMTREQVLPGWKLDDPRWQNNLPDGTKIPVEYLGLKDSGKREEFDTGANRDIRTNKGRFDLLPLEGIQRVARVFEKGCEKYGERNWEKGMPVGRYLDSALRHTFEYLDGANDEDHLGQACWNLLCAIATEERAYSGRLPKDLLLETRQTYVGHKEGE